MDEIVVAIFAQAGAAGLFANILVHLFRLQSSAFNGWRPPALAILIGIIIVFLLRVAAGDLLTWPMGAQCILAGVLAGAGAITAATLDGKVSEQRNGPMNALIRDVRAAAREESQP